jgi:hypothetical protein
MPNTTLTRTAVTDDPQVSAEKIREFNSRWGTDCKTLGEMLDYIAEHLEAVERLLQDKYEEKRKLEAKLEAKMQQLRMLNHGKHHAD